jgi:hypothetical protein
MSSTTSSSDIDTVKIIATAAAAYVIDSMIMGETDSQKSMYLGVAAGFGAGVGSTVASFLPDLETGTMLGNGKALMSRVAEIGSGVGAAYAINKFVLKNNSYRENFTNKLITLAAADVIGEYISDYTNSRPLSFLE